MAFFSRAIKRRVMIDVQGVAENGDAFRFV
jgi:hypothetical protein